MNIYIHIEVSVRELDSKLLLAVIAAAKGHNVLISDLPSIMTGLKTGLLSPGIFHTKSLTPGSTKISRHQEIINNGSIVSSIDEEGGLIDYGYDKFAKTRYSNKTINQASMVFGWGMEDTKTLKKIYPQNSSKIFMTGSPRVDLWKPFFKDYWRETQKINKKKFLLFSSNLSIANNLPSRSFYENIKLLKGGGYFERDLNLFSNLFGMASEEYKMTLSFITAIKYLSKNNNGYDIIVRPHPAENIEAWRLYLKNVPNVYVIREGSISAWVERAFAVMHHDCTTGIEATISKKHVITYNPFKRKYTRKLANQIGQQTSTLEELLKIVNSSFENTKHQDYKTTYLHVPKKIKKKIYLDKDELAAEKIVAEWEKFSLNKFSKPSNWTVFRWRLKVLKIRSQVSEILKILSKSIKEVSKENDKFADFKVNDIVNKVNKLKKLLKIKNEIKCQLISERTILIRKS